MKCLVTGAAGFIGSHLCDRLLKLGHDVTGVDAFIPYYPREVKESNLAAALSDPHFVLEQLDLRADRLDEVVADAEIVFHLGAMAGLSQSWTDFDLYSTCNILATQRLLEALRGASGRLKRLIHASTSSVYGRYSSGDETMPTKPISPYGVTKLAAEHLCQAYADAYSLPVVILRYFSVYGPRQRPDMGYHKFMLSLLRNEPVIVYGDGQQSRGNTYVADCVEATCAAVEAPAGEIYNIGGGEAASVWEILEILESLSGQRAVVTREPARRGDQRHTFAEISKMRNHLGWQPRSTLRTGLAAQWTWMKDQYQE
jgi:nucleoside-diphosphate-sugar epimerase